MSKSELHHPLFWTLLFAALGIGVVMLAGPAGSSITVQDGMETGDRPPIAFQEVGGESWTFPTDGNVTGSPTVVNGTAYVGSEDGTLYAVNTSTGTQRWNYTTGGPISTAPTVVRGTVYVGSEDETVYALDAVTGDKRWEHFVYDPIEAAPTVNNGTVFVGRYDDIRAIDADTGERRWNADFYGAVDSAPTVANDTMYFGDDDGYVYAADARSGTQRWQYQTGAAVTASPTTVDGTVYAGSEDGTLYALDAADGSVEWTYDTGDTIRSSPTVLDGTVYVGSSDGSLHAVAADTGTGTWSYATGDAVISSPTVANGSVYVGSDDGRLYAVDAASGEQEWNQSTGEAVASAPTLANGTLYVGSNDTGLHAIETGTGDSSQGSRVTLGTLGHHDVWAVAAEEELVATFDVTPADLLVGQEATISATGSHGYIESYEWEVPEDPAFPASGDVVTHAFTEGGEYNVTLTVTDEDGETDTANQTVSLADYPRYDWRYDTGPRIWGAPTVVNGTAYVGSDDNTVHAVDVETGTTVWQTASTWDVETAPSVVGGTVYYADEQGDVFAVDPATGDRLWRVETGAGNPAAPTVRNATVYVGGSDGDLLALDAETGIELWRTDTGSGSLSAPTVVGGTVYVGSTDGHVYALAADDGTQRWQSTDYGQIDAPPTVADGTVYVGSRDGDLNAMNADTGSHDWLYTAAGDVSSSPTVANGTVYFGSVDWDGHVYAVDAATGIEEWSTMTGDSVRTAPTVVEDTVYVGNDDGNVTALAAGDGTTLWEYGTDADVRSAPTVVDGTLYVGSHDGGLYALGVNTVASSQGSRVLQGTLGHHDAWAETARLDGERPPTVAVTITAANDTVNSGDVVAVNATVHNVGDREASQEITLEVDGEPVDSTNVTLASGANESVAFEWQTAGGDVGDHEMTVRSENLSDARTVSVTAETWRFGTGGSVGSSPTVVNGTVYVGSYDDHVYAVEARNGTQRWQSNSYGTFESSPSVVGDTLYIGSHDNNVYALDAETGDERWRYETGGRVRSSPTVSNGTLFVGSDDGTVYGLDADSGVELWQYGTGRDVRASPTEADGTVYVTSQDDHLYALDADAGELAWRVDVGYAPESSPTVADGVVYVGGDDHTVYALDASDGTQLWRSDSFDDFDSSPTVANGTVYVGDNSGTVRGLDAETGTQVWSYATGANDVYSSPTVVGDSLFVGSSDSRLYRLNRSDGTKDWHFETGGDVRSSPTVVNGTVFVGSDDNTLYALGTDANGSSEGSRVERGTLGHHDGWADASPSESTEPAEFAVDISETNGTVHVGTTLDVPAEITNVGDVSGTQTVSLDVDGSTIDSTNVTLDAGTTQTVTFEWPTEYSDVGDRTVGVQTANHSDETTVLVSQERWRSGDYYSVRGSATVVNGTVYVGANDNRLHAIDAATGAELWESEYYYNVVSAPAVVNGTVYVGSQDDNVYALDAANGSERWRFSTGGYVETSPTVDDGIVYVGSEDNTLYALDTETGTELWNYTTANDIHSSATVADGTVYFGSNDGTVTALDANTRYHHWTFDTGASVESSPTVANGTVYFGDTNGIVYGIDAETGAERWSVSAGWRIESSPAVANGTVYVGSNDESVYALDAATGAQEWRYSTGWDVTSSPSVAGGTVYVGSRDHHVYALDAADGSRIWDFQTGNDVWSSPTIVNDTLYVGSNDGYVYALETNGTGSSIDSRVELGTLGHHHVWADAAERGGDEPADFELDIDDSDAVVGAGETLELNATVTNLGEAAGTQNVTLDVDGAVVDGTNVTLAGGENETVTLAWATDGVDTGDYPATVASRNDSVETTVSVASSREEWRFEADGNLTASPTVVNETAFVASEAGTVYAVDADTGEQRWNYSIGSQVHAAVTVVRDTVYVGSENNYVYALDRRNGTQRWAEYVNYAVRSAPTVDNGTVYVGSAGYGRFHALDDETGNQQWVEYPDAVESSPTVHNGTVYVGTDAGRVYAYDAGSGSVEWSATFDGAVRSSPTVANGTVFVGSDDGNVSALDATDGTERWKYATGAAVRSSPTVLDGTLYVGSSNATLHAVDAGTGTGLWTAPTAEAVQSSPTIVNDTVYAGSDDGNVTAVNATTGSQRWTYETGAAVVSSPTVVDDTLFVGSNDSTLYAIGTTTNGSSQGSRVSLGTLGHHAEWAVAAEKELAASFSISPVNPVIGQEATFDASASRGYIQAYEWTSSQASGFPDTGETVSYTFSESGDYNVTLTVTDTRGRTETTTQTVAIDEYPRYEWRSEVGWRTYSSPTIVDGTVYIGSDDGRVYAIDAESGTREWQSDYYEDVESAPSVVNGTVYVADQGGTVRALFANNGTQQWRFGIDGHWDSSSPTVSNGTVYVGSQDDHVYAIDADTGIELWRFRTGYSVDSSPTVVNGTVYVGSADDHLYALDADTGEQRWKYLTGRNVGSSPTVANGTVYVGSNDNYVHAIDAETGTREWRFQTDGSVTSSPTVHADTVYVGSRDNSLYAIAAVDGTQEWRYETANSVESSPTVVNGTVYVGGMDRYVHAVDASTGTREWRFKTDDQVSSSPTIANGTLFVGDENGWLYALDVNSDGASLDSRVRLGTLGHHDGWATESPRDGDRDPTFAVEITDVSDPVHEDDVFDVTATITNVGDSEATQNVTLDANGSAVDSTPVTLAADASETVTLTARTEAGDAGDYPIAVRSEDLGDERTIQVLRGTHKRWSYEAGSSIHSSPSIVNGTVYVGRQDGTVSAIDADTGSQVWNFQTGGAVRSSPNVVDGTVYVGSQDGYVYALDAETGATQWRSGDYWNVEVSPTVLNGTVFVGGTDDWIRALDADTGNEQWSVETGWNVRSSPTVVNGTVYVGGEDHTLYAFDAETGNQLWTYGTSDDIESSPTVANGTVYLGNDDGYLYAIDADTGTQTWRSSLGWRVQSSPTVADGVVYVGSYDDSLYALDAANGTERWRFDTGYYVRSSPTVVDDTVYVGSNDNFVHALDAANGTERWRLETGGSVTSSPTVVNGFLYVGSQDGSLYSLNTNTTSSSDGSRVELGTLGHHHRWADADPPDPVQPATFAVEITDVDDPVLRGETVRVTASITNTGDYEGTQTVNLTVDGAVADSTDVTLGGSQSTTILLEWATGDAAAGDYAATVDSANDTAERTVSVRRSVEHAWSVPTGGPVQSSPTVVDGTAYVGSENGSVHALNASTGGERWRNGTGASVYTSPTTVNGTVYAGSDDGVVVARDAETGTERWRYETGDAVRSSPTVANGVVYVGSDDGNVSALDADTGSERWQYEIGYQVRSSPTVANGSVYVGSDDNYVYALDATYGDLQWRAGNYFDVRSSPTVNDGIVYVGAGDNNVYALDGDTGTEVWVAGTGGDVRSSPTVANGTVFVGSDDDRVYALNASSGAERWTHATGSNVASSPTVANRTVYVGSDDGTVYGLDAATGDPVWTVGTGDRVASSPTMVDGTLFVGSNDGSLHAIDAAVNGSSVDSRVALGTLGHHDGWAERSPGAGIYEPTYGVTINETNDPVEGENLTVTADVTNLGELTGDQDVTLAVNGSEEDVRSNLTLAGGETETVTLVWETEPGDAGTHGITVSTADYSDTRDVTVRGQENLSVAITGTTEPVEGETLTVTADVTNTGDVTTEQDVTLTVNGTAVDVRSNLSVAGGETRTVDLTWETAAGDAGTYDAVVSTADDSDDRTVQVLEPANYTVTITEATEVGSGETLAVTAAITNTGGATPEQDAVLAIDDTVEDVAANLTVPAGETRNVTLEWETNESDRGTYEANVSTADDSETTPVDVVAPANYTVAIVETNEPADGEALAVTAEVTNTGEASPEQNVTLAIDDAVVDARDLQVESGATETVNLTWATEDGDDGEYVATVSTRDDADTANVTVLQSATYAVAITDTTEPIEGENLTVTADVTNEGDVASTGTVRLTVGGTTVDSRDANISVGETETVTFTWETEVGDYGDYEATVSSTADADTANVTVVRDATFAVTIEETTAPTLENETMTVTATVENVGEVSDTRTVELRDFAGETVDKRSVDLAPGENTTLALEWTPDAGDADTDEITVASERDTDTATVTVEPLTNFAVEITNTTQIEEGENLTVTANVTNTGVETGEQDVRLLAEGNRVDTVENRSIASGATESVTLTWQTYPGDAGERTVAVASEDDSDETTVSIDERPPLSGCGVIDTRGEYQLGADVTNGTADPCIEVRASDVTIHGGGHLLDGTDGAGTAIQAGNGVDRLTVENVHLEGWATGISLAGADDSTVTDVSVDATSRGLYASDADGLAVESSEFQGVGSDATGLRLVSTDASTVVDTHVANTSDGLVVFDSTRTTLDAVTSTDSTRGVAIRQSNVTTVDGVTASNNTYGIDLEESAGTVLQDVTLLNSESADLQSAGPVAGEAVLIGATGPATPNSTVSFEGENVTIQATTDPPSNPDGLALDRYFDLDTLGGQETTAFLNVTVHYDDESVEGMNQDRFGIWEHQNDETWTEVESWVDPARNELGANVTGGSTFGAFQEPEPANFEFERIETNDPVEAGSNVTVNATVANTGDVAGDQFLTLEIDETVMDVRNVTIDGNANRTVALQWQTTENDTGNYLAAVYNDDDWVWESITVVDDLGDSAQGNTTVDIVDTNSPADDPHESIREGQTLEVTTEIQNVGNETETHDLTLFTMDQWLVAQETVRLEPNETQVRTLEWETEAGDAGEHNIAVTSNDDSDVDVVDVLPALEHRYHVNILETDHNGSLNVTARVTNVNDVQGESENITLTHQGDRKDSIPVTLGGGESTVISLEWADFPPDGTIHPVRVQSPHDSDGAAGHYDISVAAIDEDFDANTLAVTANVTNTGWFTGGTQDVSLSHQGEVKDSTPLSLASGESENVTLVWDTYPDEGALDLQVSTEEDVERLGSPFDAEIVEYRENDTLELVANITNEGELEATHEVRMTHGPGRDYMGWGYAYDQTQVDSEMVSLAPGESQMVTFEWVGYPERFTDLAFVSVPEGYDYVTSLYDMEIIDHEEDFAANTLELTTEVTNHGELSPVQDIRQTYDGTVHDSEPLSLAPGETEIVNLTWDGYPEEGIVSPRTVYVRNDESWPDHLSPERISSYMNVETIAVHDGDDDLGMRVDVENTGDLRTTQDVVLTHGAGTDADELLRVEDLQLDGGELREYNWSLADLNPSDFRDEYPEVGLVDPYSMEVSSAHDWDRIHGWWEVEIVDVVEAPGSAIGVIAEVTNERKLVCHWGCSRPYPAIKTTENITLDTEYGTVDETANFTLDSWESETVQLTWDIGPNDPGTNYLDIGSYDDTDRVQLDPVIFEINITNTNAPMTEGGVLNVSASIENTGYKRTTQEVTMQMVEDEEEEEGVVVDTTNVTIGPRNSTSVNMTWNTSKGDAGSHFAALSTEDRWDWEWTPVEPDPVCRFQADDAVQSSPTIIGDTVYIGSSDGNVYAFDAQTCTEEWSYETGGGISSSPQVVGGTVYIGSDDGRLYALDADTGSHEWQFETNDSVVSSPTVADDNVFVGSMDGHVYALDTDTGTEEWSVRTGDSVESSPTVYDGIVYIGSNDGTVYALNATDGATEWEYATNGSVFSSPTVVGNTNVYVGSDDGTFSRIDAASGEEQWTFETGGAIRSSPTVFNGTVYFGSMDTNVYAVDTETGAEEWRFQTDGYEVHSSPTVDGNGWLYIGTGAANATEGRLYELNASTGARGWQFTDAGIQSSPTVAEDELYVGSESGAVTMIETNVVGWSEDPRVNHRTLGHHNRPGSIDPIADFTFDPAEPTVGDDVVFNGTASTGDIVDYEWTSADLNWSADGAVVNRTFPDAGEYNVTLTVTDSAGNNDSTTRTVPVTEERTDPVAEFTFDPVDPTVDEGVTFDGENSTGDIVAYEWNSTDLNWSASGVVVDRSFPDAGEYNVTLTVTDSAGNTDSTTRTVPVTEPTVDPVANFTFDPSEPTVGEGVTFDGRSSTGDIVAYEWNSTDLNWSASGAVVDRSFPDAGGYDVTLRVTDSAGNTDSTTRTVPVTEPTVDPVANFTFDPSEPTVGEGVTFDGRSSTGDIVEHEWTSADLNWSASGAVVDRSFPDAGGYDVTLTVTDSNGNTDSTTRTVPVTEPVQDPVAAFTFDPSEPTVGDEVSFDGSDSAGDIVSYEWTSADVDWSATGLTVSRSFPSAADYDVTLTVTNSAGRTDSTTRTVPVTDDSGDEGGSDPVDDGNESDGVDVDLDDPYFDVTITGTNSPVLSGEMVRVVATVENTGDVTDTQTITASDTGFGNRVGEDVELTLAGGETSAPLVFEWTTTESDIGTYTVTVASDDDTDSRPVTIQDAGEGPFFDVSIVDTNDPVVEGETITATTRITNTGSIEDTQDVTVDLEDRRLHERNLTLAPDESETLPVEWETEAGDAGEYRLVASSFDDTDETILSVTEDLRGPLFVVNVTNTTAPVAEGEELVVNTTVTNTGDLADTQEVLVELNESIYLVQDVTLDGHETKLLTIDWETVVGDADEYEIFARSEDDTDDANATVEPVGDTSASFPGGGLPLLAILLVLNALALYAYLRLKQESVEDVTAGETTDSGETTDTGETQ